MFLRRKKVKYFKIGAGDRNLLVSLVLLWEMTIIPRHSLRSLTQVENEHWWEITGGCSSRKFVHLRTEGICTMRQAGDTVGCSEAVRTECLLPPAYYLVFWQIMSRCSSFISATVLQPKLCCLMPGIIRWQAFGTKHHSSEPISLYVNIIILVSVLRLMGNLIFFCEFCKKRSG